MLALTRSGPFVPASPRVSGCTGLFGFASLAPSIKSIAYVGTTNLATESSAIKRHWAVPNNGRSFHPNPDRGLHQAKKRSRQWLPARSRTKKWAEKTRNESACDTENVAPNAFFMVEAKGFDPSTVWSPCGSKNDVNQSQLCIIVYLRRRQESQVSQGGAKLR